MLRRAAEHRITVLLSAHDMNPLLKAMDRIVYLANGRAASGPDRRCRAHRGAEQLYGYHIDVIRVHGRVLVVAAGPPTNCPTSSSTIPFTPRQFPEHGMRCSPTWS